MTPKNDSDSYNQILQSASLKEELAAMPSINPYFTNKQTEKEPQKGLKSPENEASRIFAK